MTRRELARAAVLGGGVATGLAAAPSGAARQSRQLGHGLGPVLVRPDDDRYEELTTRGYNGRFTGHPDAVLVLGSPEQVAHAVQDAVRAGSQVAVRGGGHCFEALVDNPEVRVVLDLSTMTAVCHDPELQAFSVEAGATLGQVYRTLFLGWDVTVPGGGCPTVGVGGHVVGGGYGPLSSRHGLVVDHLYAVEVVVVDPDGRVRTVFASREDDDPNRDLWWAHTGGGGGSFGVVTRYWFRSPGASGHPSRLLPRPPRSLRQASVVWNWSDLSERSFARLVRNYCSWNESHARAVTTLNTGLFLFHHAIGQVRLDAQIDAAEPGAARLVDEHLAAVCDGLGVPHTTTESTRPWLRSTLSFDADGSGTLRFKAKSACLRRGWSDEQIATAHRWLTDGDANRERSFAHLGSFGGAVNATPRAVTAVAHRDAALTAYFETSWQDPAQDAEQLAWIRRFYRDLHARTGGVPVPDAAQDGAFVNYADVDLADPAWNTSGVDWSALCHGDNYPRLRQAKARWDAGDVFRHALSVRLPPSARTR